MSEIGKDLGKSIWSSLNGALGDSGGTYTAATQTQAAQIIQTTVTAWIPEHVRLQVSYSGIIPPAVPETAVDEVLVVGADSVPPIGVDWSEWVKLIETGIRTGFMTGPGNMVKPLTPILALDIPVPLETYLIQSDLGGIHSESWSDPGEACWSWIGSGIGDWLESGLPQIPVYAASLVGTGIGTITKIILI